MVISPTAEAVEVVREVALVRTGRLVFTLGNGCCDSTAAFLYEDQVTRVDAVVVGEAGGVPILAPAWLAEQYRDDELILDVDRDVIVESMSIETDIGCRFVLLHPGQERRPSPPEVCMPTGATAAPETPHPPRTPDLPEIEVPSRYRGLRLR